MDTKKFTTIDEYHATFPEATRALLDAMRKAIKQAAPKAEEVISYNMPAFKTTEVLVYYAAAKKHIGFYPTPGPIKAFADKLKGYETSKGAIQFPIDQKIPVTLVKEIVKLRIAEATARAVLKAEKKKKS